MTPREALIAEALTWRGTPFQYGQCVKGAGVDCGRFVASCLNDAGVKQIAIAELPGLSPQWFLHRPIVEALRASGKTMVDVTKRVAQEYRLAPLIMREMWSGPMKDRPEPGDIVIAECFYDWAHSALVIDWPKVIGAVCDHEVSVMTNLHRFPQYMNRRLLFFDPFMPADVGAAHV